MTASSLCVVFGMVCGAPPSDRPVTFERDIQPILTRAGCNAGACHGKARGQNGFALSLLGFDADFDYNAIVHEGRGRRIFPANPSESVFLLKAAGAMPHGGATRLPVGSKSYERVKDWIQAGCPRTPADAARLSRISIEPKEWAAKFGQTQSLAVTAHYTDGSNEDITSLASFVSNESGYAAVDVNGVIRVGTIAGEAAITARFGDQFSVCRVLIPLPGASKTSVSLPGSHVIDRHVSEKLIQLGLTPSSRAKDFTLHRRAYLTIIGRLPTPSETRQYLASHEPDKFNRLIDSLLARPEYADFWANKWADLLRPNPYHVGIKATLNFDQWLRDQFRQNVPYDQFVRSLLTSQGSTFRDGATVFYRNRRIPEELAPMVSQLFLGVRLECAKCHQHPSERWSQKDFYAFAAFFGRVGYKGTGISSPISGSEEWVYVKDAGVVKHPLTGAVLPPTPLLGSHQDIPAAVDPRSRLVDWMTAPDNPFFAKVIVNRVWADLMGRGIVDPVDDLRDTNPPTNPALLDALASEFRKRRYDLKALIRMIATSETYALSSSPNERNLGDTRNFSRHYRVRMRAEMLLDAVSDVTGVAEKFDAVPAGSRAMEAWTVRFDSKFMDSFGRPDPNQDPPCERTSETSVVQALHLMNAPGLATKITSESGRASTLANGKNTNREIVDELYLLAYGRFPTPDEAATCLTRFQKSGQTRRVVIEDLLWALINTPEFSFVD